MSAENDTAVVDAEVVDAEIADEPVQGHEAVSTQVVRRERRSEVIKPLDAAELVESFDAYQDLLPKLLKDSDYQGTGDDRFVKKSGWRKIATAFDLDVQLIRSNVERDTNGEPIRAEVWARAIAPSGRSMDGDGYCSIGESRFKGAKGRQKLENDLRATATTRAMNRAISGLVGMGAVSADEIDTPPTVVNGPPFGMPTAGVYVARTRRAIAYVLNVDATDHQVGAAIDRAIVSLRKEGYGDAAEYLPFATCVGMCALATALKEQREPTVTPGEGDASRETDEERAERVLAEAAENGDSLL